MSRNIGDVLDDMLKEVPESHEFHKTLLRAKSDACYRPPEWAWEQTTEDISPGLGEADRVQEPWFQKVLSIWMGKCGAVVQADRVEESSREEERTQRDLYVLNYKTTRVEACTAAQTIEASGVRCTLIFTDGTLWQYHGRHSFIKWMVKPKE